MIVLTHGCFDVLHIGHIKLLKYAKSLGDELVVSLLSDRYVTIAKGEGRPIHNIWERMEQIAELRCVDRVVVVDGPGHESVQKMIEEVKPGIYVKGADTRGKFGEEAFISSRGIYMAFCPMIPGRSTTHVASAL